MTEFNLLHLCGGLPKVVQRCSVRQVKLYIDDFIAISESSINEMMAKRLAGEGDYLYKQET